MTAIALGGLGCSGASSDDAAAGDEDALTKRAVSDADLARELAHAPSHLSDSDAKRLIADTVGPLATTARLKMLNDFVVKLPGDDDGRAYLAGAMEGIVWATPRDLVSTPAGFGGQTITTTISVDGGIAGPTKLQITGVAAHDYTLDLTIAGFDVKGIRIAAGSTEAATAKLVAKALDDANAKIMETIGADATFAPLGGDHADSQSGVDDLEISTSRGTVVILVAQNG